MKRFSRTRAGLQKALRLLNEAARNHSTAELTLASNPNGAGLRYEVCIPASAPHLTSVKCVGRDLVKTIERVQRLWEKRNNLKRNDQKGYHAFICIGKLRVAIHPYDLHDLTGIMGYWINEDPSPKPRIVWTETDKGSDWLV